MTTQNLYTYYYLQNGMMRQLLHHAIFWKFENGIYEMPEFAEDWLHSAN